MHFQVFCIRERVLQREMSFVKSIFTHHVAEQDFLKLQMSLKQICEREVVVNIERGMKSLRCIIIWSTSGIPVGTSL